MFDIGFSELLLFGVIALIVLGPEKLPQAARTAGQWYAKIRRTVSTLQSEIEAAVHSGQPDVWETYWLEVAFGRPLKRVVSRKSLPRLFRRDMLLGFDGVVHEHANLTNPDAKRHVFRSALWHYSRETIHDSLKKLTQYSMLGAAKRARKGRKGGVLYGLVSSTWMFIRLYIFKRAFLEGGPGFLYSFFIALEFFFRQAALKYDRPYLTDNLSR